MKCCHEGGGQLGDGMVLDLPLSCFSPEALEDNLTVPFLDGTGWKLSCVSVHWAQHTEKPKLPSVQSVPGAGLGCGKGSWF